MSALRPFLFFLVALGLFAPAAARQTPARAGGLPRPNVLIIVTDDQRTDTTMVMPQLQRWFKEEGVSYPNAYVGTPLCCPSRATIMTGRYAHNHGVVDNTSHHSMDQTTTLQALLQNSGYKTGIVGKYFNGWPLHRRPEYFDRWSIFRSGYYNTKWSVEGKTKTIRRYATDYVSARSRRLLKAFDKTKDAQPWFLYVAPSAPHEPFTPVARYANAAVPEWDPPPSVGEEDKSDKPPAVRNLNADEEGGRNLRQAQLRTLMAVDEMIGQIMATLAELRERERTLLIFVGDNGYFWAEHGLTDKRLPYTESIAVPLYARWPGRLPPGSTDPRQVSLVDIAPTVLAATGTLPNPNAPQDGRSLLDVWTREDIYTEYFPDSAAGAIGPWASVRTREFQYVEYYGPDRVTVDFDEYYDLEEDPYQLRNLVGDNSPANDPPITELRDLALKLSQYPDLLRHLRHQPLPLTAVDVAIVGGTGDEGFGLAIRLAAAGVNITIGSRALDRAQQAADRVREVAGADAPVDGAENPDAVTGKNVVFVTVPYAGQADTYRSLKEHWAEGVIVCDTTTPLASAVGGRATQVLRPWHGSAAEQARALLPDHVRLVSGFHSVGAEPLTHHPEPVDADALLCGDDADAKEAIGGLVEMIPGMRWVDCGPLEMARVLEPLTAVLIRVNMGYKVKGAGLRFSGREAWGPK